jgi:hypothetical protein
MWQFYLYTSSGRNPLQFATTEACNKSRKFHQIRNTQVRTPVAHHKIRVGDHLVGPLWRNRANGTIIDLENDPFPIAVVSFRYANELTSAERVKGVGYAYKVRGRDRNICISD